MKTLISITVAAAALVAAMPATAGQPGARSKTVSYRDLNLASADGKKELVSRVRGAVRQVCGSALAMPAYEEPAVRLCRAGAFEMAQPQLELAIERARRGTVEVAANAAGGITVSTGR